MKGRWRDNLNKFRRDNNVHLRGIGGRCTDREGTGFDSLNICGPGDRKYWGRNVHKGERRAIKEELQNPQTLADAYWELYTLGWEDSWFEPETEEDLEKLGLNKYNGKINIDLAFENFSLYDLMDLNGSGPFKSEEAEDDLEDPFDDLDHFDPRHDIRTVGYYDYLDEAMARRDAADLAETNFPSSDVADVVNL